MTTSKGGCRDDASNQALAIIQVRAFLQDLQMGRLSAGVPKDVREVARELLRHYPSDADMSEAARGAPTWGHPGEPHVSQPGQMRRLKFRLPPQPDSGAPQAYLVQDALRLVKVAADRGFDLQPGEAARVWSAYSAGLAAGWLAMPLDDEVLLRVIIDFTELC